MSSAKEEVAALLNKLPDDCTLEDLLDPLSWIAGPVATAPALRL